MKQWHKKAYKTAKYLKQIKHQIDYKKILKHHANIAESLTALEKATPAPYKYNNTTGEIIK